MREIPLTNGGCALVDDTDFERVNLYQWRGAYYRGRQYRYAVRTVNRRSLAMHNVILQPPPGLLADHIDHNGLNNTRQNLRPATHAQNAQNSVLRKGTTTGFKGVHRRRDSGKYEAYIWVNGKQKKLGQYLTPEEAGAKYNTAALARYGDFARLNIL